MPLLGLSDLDQEFRQPDSPFPSLVCLDWLEKAQINMSCSELLAQAYLLRSNGELRQAEVWLSLAVVVLLQHHLHNLADKTTHNCLLGVPNTLVTIR